MEIYIKEKIKQLEIINKSPHKNEYWKGQIDAYNEILEHLLISGVVGRSEQYCDHAVTDQKTLRCTCCDECGEILDVLD